MTKQLNVLLLREYGWPGTELFKLLSQAQNVTLTDSYRHEMDYTASNAADFDYILTYGPHIGSVLPLIKWIERSAGNQGSNKLIWWLNENLPSFDRPVFNSVVGQARALLDKVLFLPASIAKQKHLTGFAHRYRIMNALTYAHNKGLLGSLVVTSSYRRDQLQQMGINSLHVPMGWGPSDDLGKQLNLERDIDVLWLGRKSGFRGRRQKLIDQLKNELQASGVVLKEINGGLQGAERTQILNRTKILLNLLRHENDWTGHRLLLGAVNGALIVSEPMRDSHPFISDHNMVFAPIQDMPTVITHYLQNSQQREQLARNAFNFASTQLSMQQSLAKVFDYAGAPLSFVLEDTPHD